MVFAENTTVPIERSIAEIIGLLRKAGAERIGQLEEPGQFTIQFFMLDRMIRFRVALPQLDEMPELDGRGARLTIDRRIARMEQVARQRGRALLLVVKAKLESVESKVETLEQAFLANVVLADGQTVHERLAVLIAEEYSSGRIAPLLLGGPPA